jgi:hypothetical protein
MSSVCDAEHLSIMSLVLIVGMCHGGWTSEKFTDFVSIGFSDDRAILRGWWPKSRDQDVSRHDSR